MNSEPLANLARIGLLDPVPFSAALMQKMLHVAQSRLEDASIAKTHSNYYNECIDCNL